ncbi:hypothetical protein EST38_g4161 [Candolleomyces aberdarensis]|uniref:glucan 1,3-beta-glucosidase n=1 Tax=Candolleomyces aberdarensis TaxID=2316362 RepID=A0A4Q2DR56_9AGAR|nr:hypothetical protein EST38_g4161 [Candolleomyces aberdarensis]
MIIPEKPPLEGPTAAPNPATSPDLDIPPPYYPQGSATSSSYPSFGAGDRSSEPLSYPDTHTRLAVDNAQEGRSETNVSSSDATPNSSSSTAPTAKAPSTILSRLRSWRPSRRSMLIAGLVILVVDVLAIFLPIYFVIIKPRNARRPVQTGGQGSLVVADDGMEFFYENPWGGYWAYDPEDPYNDSARPNLWTPPLNTTWDFMTHRIHGVNLAGLFVLDPFVTPALFQKYPSAVDEWTLSVAMAQDSQNGGLDQLEEHYRTFITELDIAQIATAGLTWVRLPIGFWAIETFQDEPFLAQASWKYIVRVLQWCRKYGLRVNLVLASIPGSQNGHDHSGKEGSVNFLNGVMGMANAQRTLYYIRVLAEFVSQPEWTNVVPILTILDNPSRGIGVEQLRSFYVEAHRTVRETTGFGAGKGPYVALPDGFSVEEPLKAEVFDGFLNGADRVVVEKRFPTQPVREETEFANVTTKEICSSVGTQMNNSRSRSGVTVAGSFSAAFVDCGLFVNGVREKTTYQGDCQHWDRYEVYDWKVADSLRNYVAAQMDSLSDYFFYTWKIGPADNRTVMAPLWSYQLGWRNGWIPYPRYAIGMCQAILNMSDESDAYATGLYPTPSASPILTTPTGSSSRISGSPAPSSFDGTYSPWMTGGDGAFLATGASAYPWPPHSISNTFSLQTSLPTYAVTGTPITLPPPTFTSTSTNKRNGDVKTTTTVMPTKGFPLGKALAPTPSSGCNYPPAWDAQGIIFTQGCTRG